MTAENNTPSTGYFLDGREGDDVVIGSAGNDTILGSEGNDILIGGAGDDIFFFEANDGNDTIMDFHVGEDRLQFNVSRESGFTITTPFAFEDLDISSSEGNAVISVSSTLTTEDGTVEIANTITLVGVAPCCLTENDFIFSSHTTA